MKTTEIHRNFIEQNWGALSDGARYGCRLYGRGELVVYVIDMIKLRMKPWAPVPYFPDQGTQWLTSEAAELTAEYDPEEEIAVVFLCPVEGVVCYRAHADSGRIHLIEY